MRTIDECLQILKEYKNTNASKYGISRIGIFGAITTGEQVLHSDLNIFVDLLYPSLFSMVHIKDELQGLFGYTVNIARIREDMDPVLKYSIIKDGIDA